MAQPQPQPRVKVQNMVFTCYLSTPLNLLDISRKLRHRGAGYNPKKFAAVITRTKKSEDVLALSSPNFPESSPSPLKIKNFNKNAARGNDDDFRDRILAESLHPVQFHAYPITEPPPRSQRFYKDPKIAILLFRTGKVVCTGGKTEDHAIYTVKGVTRTLRELGYSDIKVVRFFIKNLVATSQVPYNIDRKKIAARYPSFCTFEPDIFPGVIMRYPGLEPNTALIFSSGKINITGSKSEEEANMALSTILPLVENFAIKFEDDENFSAVASVASLLPSPLPPPPPPEKKRVDDTRALAASSIKRSVDDYLKSIVGNNDDDDEGGEKKTHAGDNYAKITTKRKKRKSIVGNNDDDDEGGEKKTHAGDNYAKITTKRKKRKKETKAIAPPESLAFEDPSDVMRAAFKDLSHLYEAKEEEEVGSDRDIGSAKREKFDEIKKLIENSGFAESLAREWRNGIGGNSTGYWTLGHLKRAFHRIWNETVSSFREAAPLRNSMVGNFYLQEQSQFLFEYVATATVAIPTTTITR